MKTTVTAEEISRYRDRGYLIIEDLLSPQELESLKGAVTTTVEQMGNRKLVGEGNEQFQYDREKNPDTTFLQKINLWKDNDTVSGFVRNPEIGRMACELAGVDSVRLWHDQTLQKLPWSNPTSWHLDAPNWSFHSRDVLSIWIALSDSTLTNGCMWFVPGTHKTAEFERNAEFSTQVGALFDIYPEWHGLDAVPIELKAGSASVHNGLLAHGAGVNMTQEPRQAMVGIYMPDGVTFNGIQNILSAEQMEALKVGDRFNDDEQNPVVWSRQ